jgi:hypothetical protein
MTKPPSEMLGLLRELIPCVVKEVIPVDPAVQAFMQTHGLTEPPGGAGDRTNIHPDGREAFQKLSQCIESSSRSEARILTVLDCFFGLKPGDLIRPGSKLTAKRFAKNMVSERSRIPRHIVNAEPAPRSKPRGYGGIHDYRVAKCRARTGHVLPAGPNTCRQCRRIP